MLTKMHRSDKHEHRGFHIDPSALVLEIASIVIAIAIATAVGEVRQVHQQRSAVHNALVEIRSEIVENRATLRTVMALHRNVRAGFGKLLKAHARMESLSYDELGSTFSIVAPHGFQPFHALDTAWQVARDTGTSANFAYPLLTKLDQAYASQEFLDSYRDRLLSDLHGEPLTGKPNFYFVAASFEIDFADVTSAEDRLLDNYGQALSAIDESSQM